MDGNHLFNNVFATVLAAIYLGQALWGHFRRERWLGKAVVFLNQWTGVLIFASVMAVVAAAVKLLFLSEGHLYGTSGGTMGWSGEPAWEGEVLVATFALVLGASGWAVARSPARSAVSRFALFFGPGLATSIAVTMWVLSVF